MKVSAFARIPGFVHVCVLSFLLLAAGLLPMQAHAVTQPTWADMPRACLPSRAEKWIEGKAETQQAACHCPPSSMCPSASDYAKGSDFWAMTPFFVNQCCQRPTCNISYIYNSGTACPGLYSTGLRETKFCAEYEPKPVAGNPTAPAVIAEKDARDQASKLLNSCLSRCESRVDITKLKGEKYYRSAGLVDRDDNPGNDFVYTTTNQDGTDFEEYVACEAACRLEATRRLGREYTPFLKTIFVAGRGRSSRIAVPDDFDAFYQAVYSNTWRMSDSERKRKAAAYLAAHKGPVYDSKTDLSAALSCKTDKSSAICSTVMLNNGSCNSCLSPGTLVKLADGAFVKIETIKAGDRVAGQDSEGREVSSEVAKLVKLEWKSLTLYSINDGTLTLTADHPIMTADGWKAVDYDEDMEASVDKYGLMDVKPLAVGDFLKTADGTLKVTSITKTETKVDGITYNLRLKDGDSFYANGIVVRSN